MEACILLVLTLLGYIVLPQLLSVTLPYSHSSLSGFWQSFPPMPFQGWGGNCSLMLPALEFFNLPWCYPHFCLYPITALWWLLVPCKDPSSHSLFSGQVGSTDCFGKQTHSV